MPVRLRLPICYFKHAHKRGERKEPGYRLVHYPPFMARRAVIYARFSDRRDSEDLDRMVRELQAFATSKGIRVAAVIKEDDTSAWWGSGPREGRWPDVYDGLAFARWDGLACALSRPQRPRHRRDSQSCEAVRAPGLHAGSSRWPTPCGTSVRPCWLSVLPRWATCLSLCRPLPGLDLLVRGTPADGIRLRRCLPNLWRWVLNHRRHGQICGAQ
jgi:hypothetical protein